MKKRDKGEKTEGELGEKRGKNNEEITKQKEL